MALVAYDFESESEHEDNEETSSGCVLIINKNTTDSDSDITLKVEEETPHSNLNTLFSTLPETKTSTQIDQEDQIEDFIPKSAPIKEKTKVKITIPSLAEYNTIDDDDGPQKKRPKTSTKNSGLLAILPPVQGAVMSTKSFVPNSVKNRKAQPQVPTATSSLIPNSVRKGAEDKKNHIFRKMQLKQSLAGSDTESDDDIELPETFDDAMWEKVCGRPKPKPVVKTAKETPPPQEKVNIAPEPEKSYDGLDNQAFKQLVGKTKRPLGNIKLIDINEEEIMPDKDLWMTKSLTDPDMVPKAQVEDPVDPTRRKKHHITYLAQQAKANEQELQGAWAASRNNRTQSRAKYGF